MLRRLAWQKHSGRDPSLPLIALVLALVVLGAASAVIPQAASSSDDVEEQGGGVAASIDMTCFPTVPPEPGTPIVLDLPPPCDTAGIDAYLTSPTPSGRARLRVKDDDSVSLDIKLQGIIPGQTVSAWLIWYFQFRYPFDEGGEEPLPEIFRSIDEDRDIVDIFNPPNVPPNVWVPFAPAAHSVPLARTGARYSEGLGREPHQIFINQDGNGRLKVKLDYNPLKRNQGPLRNGLAHTHQEAALAGSIAAQPFCCLGLTTRSGDRIHQPVGSSLLREFDPATGFQKLDDDGRPTLVRSPLPAVFISIISSVDHYTKGMNPGLPRVSIPPLGIDIFGDHVVLGVFDLRAFHQ